MHTPFSPASNFVGAVSANYRPLPARAGLGLKSAHVRHILDTLPDLGFFEVHAENYLVDGGPLHHFLNRIREHYPLSIHGVGLSIGGEAALDLNHLNQLSQLINRYSPHSFSEHLAWSSHGDVFLNDLLPIVYDAATLHRVCDHIDQVQSHLKRPMLLENPATYIEFATSTMPETALISEIVRRTGCGLLLDINNVYVTCTNHHLNPSTYIEQLPLESVGEIHLAGFAQEQDSFGDPLLIDSHGSPVDQAVWRLYESALARLGPIASLLERDNDVPDFAVLFEECTRADQLLGRCR
jgi:uncharacterized protein